jgi:hypothetical protein
MLLLRLPEQPIKGRLRREINASVCQRRNNLTRRQTGKFLTVGHSKNLLAFSLTELVARRRANTRRARIGCNCFIAVPHPPLVGSNAQTELGARKSKSATSLGCFANQRHT